MKSLWSDTARMPSFEPLAGDLKTDVLVIGGGMAGLLCAYELTRAGVEVVLVEADRLCGGVTQNTTAKITSQHGLIYQTLIRRFGVEWAGRYLRANEEAIARFRELCREIDCDFETRDSYVYAVDDPEKLSREMEALSRLRYYAQLCTDLPLPFSVAGAVKFTGQAQFHPLKFAAALAAKLRIYEHTKVRELAGKVAVTERGRIRAEQILVATHFPFLNKHGWYFLKMYQHRSYVLGLAGAPAVDGMYVDESDTGLSFRSSGGLLLLGGGGHRTGKRGGGWAETEAFAAAHYPAARVRYRWATQDCMTLDGMPYIGRYGKHASHLLVATGFNKWGMTSSMVAARVLTDLVLGKSNEYACVLDPSRSLLRPQLAVNTWEALCGWLTPTGKRCPHLGCALKWNPQEHSWDCPCHGSRFSQEGQLIDNPATGDLKKGED